MITNKNNSNRKALTAPVTENIAKRASQERKIARSKLTNQQLVERQLLRTGGPQNALKQRSNMSIKISFHEYNKSST